MKDTKIKTTQNSSPSGKKSETDDTQDTAQTKNANFTEGFVLSDKIEIKPFKGIISG